MAPTGSVTYKFLEKEVAPLNPEPQTRRTYGGCSEGLCKEGTMGNIILNPKPYTLVLQGGSNQKGTEREPTSGPFWGKVF